jgi:hypothetical protein
MRAKGIPCGGRSLRNQEKQEEKRFSADSQRRGLQRGGGLHEKQN